MFSAISFLADTRLVLSEMGGCK